MSKKSHNCFYLILLCHELSVIHQSIFAIVEIILRPPHPYVDTREHDRMAVWGENVPR